eukprot:GFYU01006365.1.p1 GENE.GFYU01006365.1~~GFYU01006365.1.p1  ORF type:complete len:944 (-),score=268.53 GFYU01006365.1:64-2895(-)
MGRDTAVQVYSWGSGRYGQLGQGSETPSKTPLLIESLQEKYVVDISCGASTSACVGAMGELYTWGDGDCGKLGHGDYKQYNIPRTVQELRGHKAVAVSCGSCHTIALTDKCKVFTWGSGMNGLLGHGSDSDQLKPKHLTELDNKNVKDICAGAAHSLALTQTGDVYSWGKGDCGQVGHGDLSITKKPRLVTALVGKRIRGISCGYFHNGAVSDIGEVFTWGSSEYGQLGHGDWSVQPVPMRVDALAGRVVTDIQCGHRHTLAITEHGDLYAWGGSLVSDNNIKGSKAADNVPRVMQFFLGKSIQVIACGFNHSACVDVNGDVYTWSVDTIDTPKLVSSVCGMNIRRLACGGRHTLATAGGDDTRGSVSRGSLRSGSSTSTTATDISGVDQSGADPNSSSRLSTPINIVSTTVSPTAVGSGSAASSYTGENSSRQLSPNPNAQMINSGEWESYVDEVGVLHRRLIDCDLERINTRNDESDNSISQLVSRSNKQIDEILLEGRLLAMEGASNRNERMKVFDLLASNAELRKRLNDYAQAIMEGDHDMKSVIRDNVHSALSNITNHRTELEDNLKELQSKVDTLKSSESQLAKNVSTFQEKLRQIRMEKDALVKQVGLASNDKSAGVVPTDDSDPVFELPSSPYRKPAWVYGVVVGAPLILCALHYWWSSGWAESGGASTVDVMIACIVSSAVAAVCSRVAVYNSTHAIVEKVNDMIAREITLSEVLESMEYSVSQTLKQVEKQEESSVQLQQTTADLRQYTDSLSSQIDTLEPKADIRKQVLELEGHAVQLESSVQTMVRDMKQLQQKITDASELAVTFRSVKNSKDDHEFRKQFDLPTTEFVIERYSCVSSKMVHGYLHITPSYLCFDTLLFGGSSHKCIIPITKIAAVKKTKFAGMFDNALEIQTAESEVHTFSSIVGRNNCYLDILAQAEKFGTAHFLKTVE